MTTLYTVTMVIATDADPSTLLDEAIALAKHLGDCVETTSDEDDIENWVSVSEYQAEGQAAPRAVGVHVEVSDYQIACLIASALEGGSNYWAYVDEILPPDDADDLHPVLEDTGEVFPHIDYPLADGGAVILRVHNDAGPLDDKKLVLNREAIERGTKTLARQHAHHWADFIRGDYDATTADVFLQCCVLGEVIYG